VSKAFASFALIALFATPLVAQEKSKAPKKEAANAESPMALERSIFDALTRNDVAAFNKALGGDFVFVSHQGSMTWEVAKSAETLKDCKTGKFTLSNMQEKQVTPDLVVLTYTAAGEQTCGGQKQPSPVNAMSVWRKAGGRWVAVAHSEAPASPPGK
jgi:ketosteroid isomerase-like protein